MNKLKKFAYWLEVAALGIVLGLIIQGARAWTEPTQDPPGGNLGAPVNTSGATQAKAGSLGLFSANRNSSTGQTIDPNLLGLLVSGKIQADDFCFNNDPMKCLSNNSGGVEYQMSCAFNNNEIMCCRMRTSDGITACKGVINASSPPYPAWYTYPTGDNPSFSPKSGENSLTCSGGGGRIICCRTVGSNGETDCQIRSGAWLNPIWTTHSPSW